MLETLSSKDAPEADLSPKVYLHLGMFPHNYQAHVVDLSRGDRRLSRYGFTVLNNRTGPVGNEEPRWWRGQAECDD